MTPIDRRVLFTSGAAAALFAATGTSLQAKPKRGGRLRAALSAGRREDHWGISDNAFMQAARGAVFETLTEIAGDGTLRGDIAQAWETEDAGKSWVFHLSAHVVFHDGMPLQAADILSLFERFPELDVANARLNAEGRLTVALRHPNPSLPYLLADPRFAVLPAQTDRQIAGIGSGLYRVDKFQAGRHFIGSRVHAHRKANHAGWFDQVEFTSIPSETVRAEALRRGLVDVADISMLDAYSDPVEYQLLPSPRNVQQICRRTIALPDSIGQSWALDNNKMALRWWMA